MTGLTLYAISGLTDMGFSAQDLIPHLPDLSASCCLWVAYSGGMDSHVLLDCMLVLKQQIYPHITLKAIHVHHGISENADQWQQHCEETCASLGLSLVCESVKLEIGSGPSLENLAREARYKVFEKHLAEADYLLMGHHEDDQIETILFRFMRGAGPRGLAAIPDSRKIAQGYLIRPLLHFPRKDLRVYAETRQLHWIEDESNCDLNFDRNFLRLNIFPLLEQRWPSFRKNWLRSAQLCAEAEQLQMILAKQDFTKVSTDHSNRLCISALKQFDAVRQRNTLRFWFSRLQQEFLLPLPDYNSLQRIITEVLSASVDAEPLVSWSDQKQQVDVRRFADELYVLSPIAPSVPRKMSWDMTTILTLRDGLGQLSLEAVSSNGLCLHNITECKVVSRSGGEMAKPAGRKTRSLKKIFQDYGVPPWLRDKVPLIYINDELAAVADIFICEKWQQDSGKDLYRICWERPDIHCGY